MPLLDLTKKSPLTLVQNPPSPPDPTPQELNPNLLLQALKDNGSKKSVKELLTDENIGTEDAIRVIAGIAHAGDSDTIRLRAAEMALKLSGDLVENEKAQPTVIINIKGGDNFEVNPIYIPRT